MCSEFLQIFTLCQYVLVSYNTEYASHLKIFFYSTDQKKPNKERLFLLPFHMLSRSHSLAVRYLFYTCSISFLYPFHSVLLPFCQCSIG